MNKYHGNPKEYYLAHLKEFWDSKTRGEMAQNHPGMYRALARAGQLEEVFPEADARIVEGGRVGGKKRLSKGEITEILWAYRAYDKNAMKASEYLPYPSKTILRYWRKAKFSMRKRGQHS